MNLGELKTETLARGFDYLGQDQAGITRMTRWLNEAYTRDICDLEPWPFLEQTTTGTAPLVLGDIKDILSVVDSTNGSVLDSADQRDLLDSDPRNTSGGIPNSYVIDGLATIRVYPAQSVSLSVRYIGVPAMLVNDADVPVIPARFHNLIVDAAVIRALRDSDNYEGAAAVQQAFDQDMVKMEDAFFSRNFDNTQYVQRVMDHEGF